MSVLLRKWIRAHKIVRIAVAIAYLLITFIVPLHHACNPCRTGPPNCRFDNVYHCHYGTGASAQFEVVSERDNGNEKALSHNRLCLACMYSTTGKTTEVNSAATPISIEIPISVQHLLRSKVVKQAEWASSIVSRAPPITNS